MTNNKALSVLLLALVTLFILNSPATTFAAAEDDPEGSVGKPKNNEPYKTVNKFCKTRSDRKDREFCAKALKSDPRSASAKNLTDLCHISVDLALTNTNKTREYLLATLSKKEKSKQPLIWALKECVSEYDVAIEELKNIPKDMEVYPVVASYEALLANDALDRCRNSLKRNKITDHSILRTHKIADAYVLLCVDIAMGID